MFLLFDELLMFARYCLSSSPWLDSPFWTARPFPLFPIGRLCWPSSELFAYRRWLCRMWPIWVKLWFGSMLWLRCDMFKSIGACVLFCSKFPLIVPVPKFPSTEAAPPVLLSCFWLLIIFVFYRLKSPPCFPDVICIFLPLLFLLLGFRGWFIRPPSPWSSRLAAASGLWDISRNEMLV